MEYSTVSRTLTKLLHLRRATSGHETPTNNSSSSPHILFSSSTSPSSSSTDFSHKDDPLPPHAEPHELEAMESLIAELFATVSSIKAAYAQLQFAQSPYDPASIQSADLAVVTELRHVSRLKQSFSNGGFPSRSPLASKLHEQRSLVKTYEVTSQKLQSDLDLKDSELLSLRSELSNLNLANRELERKLYPGKTLASVDGLHLSGLDPMHFLTVVRFTVKSIRSFVKLMVKHMTVSGWDLRAAAASVHPDVIFRQQSHLDFAFESFVCAKIFSDFHRRDFNLRSLQERGRWDRIRFFQEFTSLKSVNAKELLERKQGTSSHGFENFCRAKYMSLIQPKMEASFFGDLEQRDIVKSGNRFPDSEWFACFAEMARRVWLLHCIFFSFAPEMESTIFRVKRGSRFSELYMESVVSEERGGAHFDPAVRRKAVEFTVVPGFKVGRTVIQSRAYLSDWNGRT